MFQDAMGMITQIYEIQTPREAEGVIEVGADHVGSVVLDETAWKQPVLKETIERVRVLGATSSLIPLFSRPESVWRALDYYQPDIVHFCEDVRNIVAFRVVFCGILAVYPCELSPV